jgi:hypothetical protein
VRLLTKCASLLLFAGLLPAAPAFTQTSTAARIYVQSTKGIYAFDASSSGRLTPIKGSPFAETGQMGGIRGSYFITVGTYYLHSYKREATGGVRNEVAKIDTQKYAGSNCGTNWGPALLDHTGQYFSVALVNQSNTPATCSALQTYKIASNGEFTFLGDAVGTQGDQNGAYQMGISTYSSNDKFAYGLQYQGDATAFLAYRRDTAGDLVTNGSFTQTGPTPSPSDNTSYEPVLVAADPASHLAAVMNQPFGPNSHRYQLASYTINNSTGAIHSTNTSANIPVLQVYPIAIAMSWGGNYVAVSGTGLQVFHFNGSAPATSLGSVLLPKLPIGLIAWDQNNHLYALSSTSELYVFTVTSSGITPTAGSPYSVPESYGNNGLIVVPQ